MNLPDNCPLCCAHVLVEWDGKQRKSERSATFECQTSIYAGQAPRQTQSRWCEVRERQYLAARVAELEAQVREAEESSANALACLSAAEATIELRRLENEAVRRQLGHAENACDAMEKRVADLEAREKQRAEDEEWAKANKVVIDSEPVDKCWCAMVVREDGPLIEVPSANGCTIAEAIRALRKNLEAKP